MLKRRKENILIVYYSYSGKTRRIAEMIQEQTGGSLSRIYPRQPYPSDFEGLLIQVKDEIRTGKKIPMLPVKEKADDYDVIFVGSPNWCGTIAPPIASWLRENTLDQKIVLPFFSHCGGEDKGMEQAVRNLCPGASVGSCLYVLENGSEDRYGIIREWLKQNFPAADEQPLSEIGGSKVSETSFIKCMVNDKGQVLDLGTDSSYNIVENRK